MVHNQENSGLVAKEFEELSLRELHAIYCTRAEVFTAGQQITEPDPDMVDTVCIHIFSRNEQGTVLAYARVFDLGKYTDDSHQLTPGAWTIGRVAVHPQGRGTGLGHELVDYAISWIRQNTPAQRIEISAQSYLKDTLYEKFTAHGSEFIEAGIPHIQMSLELNR